MVTDFSVINNAVQVSVGGIKQLFINAHTKVQHSTDLLQLTITFANPFPSEPSIFNVPVSDLRISGSVTPPVDLASALLSLSSVLPKVNQISSNASSLGYESTATYAAISTTRTDLRLVIVATDETASNATNQVYLFSGSTKMGQLLTY